MSDDKALATYDPEKIMDSVKAKIRSEFVSLMPDQAWNALVKKAIDSFFERKSNHYGSGTSPSEFDMLVRKLIEEEAKKKVYEILQGPEWAAAWANGRETVSQEMAKIIKDNASEIVSRLLGQAMQNALTSMLPQLR